MKTIKSVLKKQWFLIGLVVITIVTLADSTNTIKKLGLYLKNYRGADIGIVLVFLFSGLALKTEEIKKGLTDIQVTLISLLIIFVIAPLLAMLINLIPLAQGIKIGIFLVAVMPTTLSTGVVMTSAAGGNMAQALFITVLANLLCVFTIPVTLSILINIGGQSIPIDRIEIMIRIGELIFLPLMVGIFLKPFFDKGLQKLPFSLSTCNQIIIWSMVWMGLAQSKETILSNSNAIFYVVIICFIYHGLMLLVTFSASILFHIEKGRRESVIFMGGQKTLALAILLQVTLFPQYGIALAVCVMHHFIHLMMDGYLVGFMSSNGRIRPH